MANHVLILEPSWNPVFEEQAISRANRLGQTGPINVVRYVANRTVDSYLRTLMLQAASEDDGVQELLMDAVEQKGTFESDDKALNNTIGKVRNHDWLPVHNNFIPVLCTTSLIYRSGSMPLNFVSLCRPWTCLRCVL